MVQLLVRLCRYYCLGLFHKLINFSNLCFIFSLPKYSTRRGSSGYSNKFGIANFKDLGGGDFKDIMAGIDYIVKEL